MHPGRWPSTDAGWGGSAFAGRECGRALAKMSFEAADLDDTLGVEGLQAGLDEGLLSLTLFNLLYMANSYSYKKFR